MNVSRSDWFDAVGRLRAFSYFRLTTTRLGYLIAPSRDNQCSRQATGEWQVEGAAVFNFFSSVY